MMPLSDGVAAVEDFLRGGHLSFEDRLVGDVAVPLDQRRNRPTPRDHDLEQFPDDIRDRTIMAVDQQRLALVIGLCRLATAARQKPRDERRRPTASTAAL